MIVIIIIIITIINKLGAGHKIFFSPDYSLGLCLKFSIICRLIRYTKVRQNPCFERVYCGIFFLAGVAWGLGGWAGGVCMSLGFPRLLPLFLGGLPALPCGMVVSCRLVACGGLLRSVGGRSGVLLGMYGL